MQPICNGPIPNETRCHGDLQGKPVLGVAYIQDVSAILWYVLQGWRFELLTLYMPCKLDALSAAIYDEGLLCIPSLSSVASISSFDKPKPLQ